MSLVIEIKTHYVRCPHSYQEIETKNGGKMVRPVLGDCDLGLYNKSHSYLFCDRDKGPCDGFFFTPNCKKSGISYK